MAMAKGRLFSVKAMLLPALILVVCSSCPVIDALIGWPWRSSTKTLKPPPQIKGRASYESVQEGIYSSHRSPIKEAQDMALSLIRTTSMADHRHHHLHRLDPSCWQTAYGKLFASCREILRDEERKCRLAYEFTVCFMTMTGWPPPSACPDSKPVKACTEQFDKHTHEVYLAFFVDSVAMCHHLQSEAFQQETDEVINDLKQSGHWIIEKVKEVEGLSQQILDDTLDRSEKVQEKLATLEAHSDLLRQQQVELEGLLNNAVGTVEAVYNNSDQVVKMQMEMKDIHQEMNSTLLAGFKELDDAAHHTHQQLDDISHGQEEIARHQVELAQELAENIEHVKQSALSSLDELKDSQEVAMDETRSSLKGLSEGARRAQVNFELWRLELDKKNQRLLRGSEDMLKAQEAFVSKQGSILATLDRLFSLYDSILYESRAFKMFIFYATSLVFLHVLTCAKQTGGARALLYLGLCASLGLEIFLMRTYGTLLKNQQWLQSRCSLIRTIFAAFTAVIIVFFIFTYRDINWTNHELLLEIRQRVNKHLDQHANEEQAASTPQSTTESVSSTLIVKTPPASSHLPRLAPSLSSRNQAFASKIIGRMHKFLNMP